MGAGLTGLWTAYHLLALDPSLDVLVLEARHVGFGASGRNGGWASAHYPAAPEAVARAHGEGIDAGYRRGGTVVVARGPAQVSRARAWLPTGSAARRSPRTAGGSTWCA